jgi:DNA-binding GntR family transcriptional regulator
MTISSDGRPSGLAEWAYSKIKKSILDLTLPPDSHINEMQLAEMLGISRTPVREALMRLKQEEWILESHGQRLTVRPLTALDARDMYEMRILLEPKATVHFAAQATDEQLQTLVQLAAHASEELAQGSYEGFLVFHRHYQEMLIDNCPNSILSSVLLNLEDLMARFRKFAGHDPDRHIHLALSEHRVILAALIQRDADAVEHAVISHLQAAGERVLAQISAKESQANQATARSAAAS